MKYGVEPKTLGVYTVDVAEMMHYQYLPVKFPGQIEPVYEQRLSPFNVLMGAICCDFIGVYGLDKYKESYLYLTAKNLFQSKGCSFNRPGYHSDGFMTDDVNYIWSDRCPTVFNIGDFRLSQDDELSLSEMAEQALPENDVTYPVGSLLRLDQYNIHRVAETKELAMRAFLKASFSLDKYDLSGNAHNYLLNYDWPMRTRKVERNIPQVIDLKP